MLKFIHPADEKLMILDGLVPKFIGKPRKQFPANDTYPDEQNSNWIGWRGVEYQSVRNVPPYDHLESFGRVLSGKRCGTAGKFLNDSTICKIGRNAYTHFQTEYYADNRPCYPSIMQWDVHERNVTTNSGLFGTAPGLWWPAKGGRDIFGRGWINNWEYYFFDPGLIEYNGNLVVVAAVEGWYSNGDVKSQSDGRFCIFDTINDTELEDNNSFSYVSFLFNPNANNGSGIGVFNGFNGSGQIYRKDWFDELRGDMWGDHIWNITSMKEFHGDIYAASLAHVFRFEPSGNFGRIIYRTDGDAFRPSPKWFEKHDENLYMLEASGTISQIIPSGENTIVNGIYDFSYIEPYNLKWGGMHVGQQGYVRATKSDVVSYNDKLHVFLQIGSGTYYFSSSGDLSTWDERTDELPSIFNDQQGNIYSYHDNISDKLYVFYNTMSSHGLVGVRNWGNEETGNIFHMYLYDDSSWEYKGWFTDSTRQSNGGFVPFNDKGPHAELPSGQFFPRGFDDVESTVTPYFFVCKDFATIDYKLYHEESANVDVNIEFSLDEGCTWSNCERKKDYRTQQMLGEPKTGLSASPSGEWHTFYWDFIRTLGYNVDAKYCKIRITPLYGG